MNLASPISSCSSKSKLKHGDSCSLSSEKDTEGDEDDFEVPLPLENPTKENKLHRVKEITSLLGILFKDKIATAVEDFEALSNHSKQRKTNPGTNLPKEELELALHFMKFASAAYGWKLVYGMDTSKSFGIFKCLAKTSKANDDVICFHTGIKKEDILMRTAKTNGIIPGFYLALDHSSKSLVLAIRGTQTLSDTLTDLVASAFPFLNEWAHKGMVFSALELQMKIQQKVAETFEQYPDYKMVFVGHSLGAGIATILALMYRDEDPNAPVFCFAYAPPCTVSRGLAIKGRAFIRSYIYGDDVIPRLTYNSIQQLRAMCAFHSRKASKRRLVMSRCANSTRTLVYPPSMDRLTLSDTPLNHNNHDELKKTVLALQKNFSENDASILQEDVEDFVTDADSDCISPRKQDSTPDSSTNQSDVTATTTTMTTTSTIFANEFRGDPRQNSSSSHETEEYIEGKSVQSGEPLYQSSEAEVKVPKVEEDLDKLEEESLTETQQQTLFPAGVIYHIMSTSVPIDQNTEFATVDGIKLDSELPIPPGAKKNNNSSRWWRKKTKKIMKTTEMMYWELEHIIFSFNMFNHHLPPFYEYAFKCLLHQTQNSQTKENKPRAPTFTQRFFARIPRWR